MKVPSQQCPLTKRESCPICGLWLGSRGTAHGPGWQEVMRGVQRHHDAKRQQQVDSWTTTPA